MEQMVLIVVGVMRLMERVLNALMGRSGSLTMAAQSIGSMAAEDGRYPSAGGRCCSMPSASTCME